MHADGGPGGDRPSGDGPSSDRHVLVSGVTLGTFVVLGVFVAFAAWGVVPRETLVVGAPAVAAGLLVEWVAGEGFGVRLGVAVWAVVYAGLYLQAALFGFWMRWWRRASARRRSVDVE